MTKNLLLVTAAMLAATSVQAKVPVSRRLTASNVAHTLKTDRLKVVNSTVIAPGMVAQELVDANGMKVRKILSPLTLNNSINPTFKAPARAAADGSLLNEGFESGTPSAGWSSESKAEISSPWIIAQPNASEYSGFSGSYAAMLQYDPDYIDEWLYTPVVSGIQKSMELSFMYYVSPFYMFDTENIDMDAGVYIGEKKQTNTLKVLASTDGGTTWDTLLDMAQTEPYKSMQALEAAKMVNGELTRFAINLDQYAGQTVRFAFEYVGTNGDNGVLDDVCVGYPPLNADYTFPPSSLFYGVARDLSCINYSIPLLPAYSPITWLNTSEGNPEDTSYSWAYMGPDNEDGVSTERDLTLTYHTDYTSEFSTRNNLYTTPVLTASAPMASSASANHFTYFQAGGTTEMMAADADTGIEELINFGAATFDINTEGMDIYTSDDSDETPIFGYNPSVDIYWKEVTFHGEAGSGDYARLDAILNHYTAPDSPIVINGAWVHAVCTNLKSDAEFKLEVIPLDAQGKMTAPIATATCKAYQAEKISNGSLQDFLTVGFNFDNPVIISSADFDRYIIRFSGFNNCADYFAPFQSTEDNYAGVCLGWIDQTISMNGQVTNSQTPLSDYTGKNQSFAIMLDATYPYLHSEGEINLPETGIGELQLDSYYNVADLLIEDTPSWLTAALSGTKYNDARLMLHSNSDMPQQTTVTIYGNGVRHEVKVKTPAVTSVGAIQATTREVKAIYTPAGVKVAEITAPGLYIVTYTDGTVEKKAIR